MGADEMPDSDSPLRIEIVHQSERTRVTRLFLAERTVIRKEPLGSGAEARLRQEVAMLERLRGVPGVAQLADELRFAGSIVLEDAGRVSLEELARPLAAGALAGLAADLAAAVAGMHRRGVIHRDITPANIVRSNGGAICLVDFALATPLAEIRPEFTHYSGIAGTLPYLAPESQATQLGRRGTLCPV
jgi:serine/threonine protein kinase